MERFMLGICSAMIRGGNHGRGRYARQFHTFQELVTRVLEKLTGQKQPFDVK